MTETVHPLLTAAEAFPALERAAAGASRRIWLSFRVFDFATKLRTGEARALAPGDDWASLLAAKAAEGVDIRVQVSDFDPIGGASLHRAAWASLRHLHGVVERAAEAQGRIQAIAARHPARTGAAIALALASRARREVRALRNKHGAESGTVLPGLDAAAGVLPKLYPATHHQKIAVFDDRAVVGGLDVDERRWDTLEHDRAADETWRDVTFLVQGSPAGQVASALSAIWNRAVEDGEDQAAPQVEMKAFAQPERIEDSPMPRCGDFDIVQTSSVYAPSVFGFGPRTKDRGTAAAFKDAIRAAQSFLFIETQYLRSAEIAEALVDAAARNSKLELVVILPFAPEEIAFDGHEDRMIWHGEALQVAAIARIREAFGDRCAFLSPAKTSRRQAEDKFAAYGAGIIYVHSKIMIADDQVAIVGSANLNDRSLHWDTEVSAVWRDRTGVRQFLERLAESWLGDVAEDVTRVETWRARATANAAAPPELRDSFLLPHDTRRAGKLSRNIPFLPDAFF